VSGNIRVAGGSSNVVENVESSHSNNRGLWAQTQKLIVSGGSYHHNDADGIDIDSSSSHCTIHNNSLYMNARCGIFLEFSASYNTIVGNDIFSNHFSNVGTGALDGSQTYNVIIANRLGPSDFPAGCRMSSRPCPSYCPVNDSCQQVVGLPCGTCHYVDQRNYEAHGFSIGSSKGIVAVLNDLGGSTSSSSGRGVEDALVALNYNGSVDNSDHSPNTSAYSWNPDAR
jgi:parallel beta-helix repeat protein